MSLASLNPVALGEASLLEGVREALLELEHADSLDQLFARIAETTAFLGLDHLLVSRYVSGRWQTIEARGYADPRWQLDLDALAARVPHTAPRPIPCAAIVADGTLLGALQARRHRSQTVDAADAAALALLAQGVGHLAQRITLSECVDQIHEMLSGRGRRSSAISVLTPGEEPQVDLPAAAEPLSPLTDRERDIMELVARGDTNAQVARQLFLTEGTVKWHVKNILRKLDAPNRAAAVSTWLRR